MTHGFTHEPDGRDQVYLTGETAEDA